LTIIDSLRVRSYGAELAQCGIGRMFVIVVASFRRFRRFLLRKFPPMPAYVRVHVLHTLIKANLIGLIEKTVSYKRMIIINMLRRVRIPT